MPLISLFALPAAAAPVCSTAHRQGAENRLSDCRPVAPPAAPAPPAPGLGVGPPVAVGEAVGAGAATGGNAPAGGGGSATSACGAASPVRVSMPADSRSATIRPTSSKQYRPGSTGGSSAAAT